ncbi:hypothetical protein AA310_00610 [Arthrobacter sp. YC-RL1]|uniref:DUF433 domain-containing protein n=1 Tax=Arthrobacter sp. YC-RL1 TaxID=1652545 RepID=UPI00063DB345|nr:DUF433 domain-containing protein [Arthrobacter sp. YC-RL1]ALQ29102.1 hypothetical protein ATC04_00085 [Arthrobacter sp. YC-RL1]ALQ32190.1 hypothetical protein ATC04_17715 [Arthrobacter sp. YC-RL1]KLI90647.1 hypothetical protein AA310_00610 [Arthrobacter sp. YC-RL1]
MSFPEDITSALTGVTPYQLAAWRTRGILLPEISRNPIRYSFRDVIALRAFAFLRSKVSLQKLRRALDSLDEFKLFDHPSAYHFGSDGKTIVVDDGNEVIDLVRRKGQREAFTMAQIFEPFRNFNGTDVVDFRRPRPNLEINPRRMGGWPTVVGTRVPFDAISDLLDGGFYSPEHIVHFYPSVTVDGARDALDFSAYVAQQKRGA